MIVIDEKRYKVADPKVWLVFNTLGHEKIHPILAGRLAYLSSVKRQRLYISRGFVSYEEQKAIGDSLLKQNPTWYKTESGAIYKPALKDGKGNVIKAAVCMVAAPGNSNHEFGHAIDSGDSWFKLLTNSELEAYGLFKPILPDEPWHVQLLETKGVSKAILMQNYVNSSKIHSNQEDLIVSQFQTAMQAIGLYSGKIDNDPGPKTKAAVKKLLPLLHRILGTDYKTPEDTIKETQNGPDLWLCKMKEIPYFGAFIMNIVDKMKGLR